MNSTYPGTTVEVVKLERQASKALFDGIFATGGITLSQVSLMTGLEPYLIQNWVKRGFVSPPVKRLYSREQFARIVIINMLREALQIDCICNLIRIIGKETDSPDDDLISNDELYHRYVNMLCDTKINLSDKQTMLHAAMEAAEDFQSPYAGASAQLVKILQIMLYAHAASALRANAETMLASLS